MSMTNGQRNVFARCHMKISGDLLHGECSMKTTRVRDKLSLERLFRSFRRRNASSEKLLVASVLLPQDLPQSVVLVSKVRVEILDRVPVDLLDRGQSKLAV